jgi:hypothetical protein
MHHGGHLFSVESFKESPLGSGTMMTANDRKNTSKRGHDLLSYTKLIFSFLSIIEVYVA